MQTVGRWDSWNNAGKKKGCGNRASLVFAVDYAECSFAGKVQDVLKTFIKVLKSVARLGSFSLFSWAHFYWIALDEIVFEQVVIKNIIKKTE